MTEEKPKILIVDDRPENLYTMQRLFESLDSEVLSATSGIDALNLTLSHEFALAIVDIQMPGMDGYEMTELLRSNSATASLPVLFVSAIYSDAYHHNKGYEAGAVDFLSKPFNPDILLSKVKIFLELYRQRKLLENEVQQRRKAEAALQAANASLVRLNADKDKFFSIISHDLRAPFNTILGNVQLLSAAVDFFSKEDVREMADSILKGTRTVYSLLDNLLLWARMQRNGMQFQPGEITLQALGSATLAVLAQTAEQKGIILENGFDPALCVIGDQVMLQTVLRNLVGNAIKFTPSGGKIRINAEPPENGQVTIVVEDTGIGMTPEQMAKLFRIDVHYSTAGTQQEAGSGLGLLICQEMVEKHGGKIWVESEIEKGTKMKFSLPYGSSSILEK